MNRKRSPLPRIVVILCLVAILIVLIYCEARIIDHLGGLVKATSGGEPWWPGSIINP